MIVYIKKHRPDFVVKRMISDDFQGSHLSHHLRLVEAEKEKKKKLSILTSGDNCFDLRWLIIMAKTIAPQKSDGLLCFHSFYPPLFHTLLFSFSSFTLSVFKNTHTFVIFVWGMLREIY